MKLERLSSRPFRRRRAAAAMGLLFVACNFGSYEAVVPWLRLQTPDERVLTVTVDGSSVWAVNQLDPDTGMYSPRLKVFDADNGVELASTWWGGSWGVRAVAPANEAGYEDTAWVLHQNGYRIRWNPTLVGYSEIEVPIPTTGEMEADSRLYCDMDHDQGGVQFVTALDGLGPTETTYIYREPSETVWERVAVPWGGGKCAWVSYDGPADTVGALIDDAHEIHLFDADDLSPSGSIDLSAITGDINDFALIGGHAVLAVDAGASDELVIVDSTGAIQDTQALGSAIATYVHIDGDVVRAFWAGVDTWSIPKYAVGVFELED